METNMTKQWTVTVLAILGLGLLIQGVKAQTSVSSRPKLSAKEVEEMMTTLSNWGRWGKEDQLGALNLITPHKRKQAAAQVTEGVSVSLARELARGSGTNSTPFSHQIVSTGLAAEST